MQKSATAVNRQLHSVENSLNILEVRRQRLEEQKDELARTIRQAKRTVAYLSFVRWFRSPTTSVELWPIGLMIVGPLAGGAIAFIVVHAATGAVPLSLGMSLLGAIAAAAALAGILFFPAQKDLAGRLDRASATVRDLRPARADASRQLDAVLSDIRRYKAERDVLVASADYQRSRLLLYNWKAMRGTEFEEYLAMVLQSHGAAVELTKASGDQGVDLVAQFGARRIAIQAKGYVNSVGNSAVQQVVAGYVMYGCHACAVITNSCFTASAIELADAHGCTLIGEDEFEGFVMGRLRL